MVFSLLFAHVVEIIEDQGVKAVEFGERRRQSEIASCGLEILHEIGRAAEQEALAVLDL